MFFILQLKCLENCPCDEPKNWRSQSISLTHLEEVKIANFKGGERKMDLVTMTLRWAPRLKTMVVKLAYEMDNWTLRHEYLRHLFGISFS